MPDGFVQINCYMLDQKTIEENPNMTGDYNVARAISVFNKRIEPLLVVFKDEIRNSLLVENPQERGLFTASQCELINGHPFDEKDQDSLEEVLTLSDGEIEYWNKTGIDSNYMYELAEEGWEEKIN
jgi:hypothetical protein